MVTYTNKDSILLSRERLDKCCYGMILSHLFDYIQKFLELFKIT